MGMRFKEIYDLLCCNTSLEGRLKTGPSQGGHNQVRKGILNPHEELEKSQLDLRFCIGIYFEVRLDNNKFVAVCLGS